MYKMRRVAILFFVGFACSSTKPAKKLHGERDIVEVGPDSMEISEESPRAGQALKLLLQIRDVENAAALDSALQWLTHNVCGAPQTSYPVDIEKYYPLQHISDIDSVHCGYFLLKDDSKICGQTTRESGKCTDWPVVRPK